MPDQRAVFIHAADDRVAFNEVELFLHRRRAFDQLTDRPQAIGAVGLGDFAGRFDLVVAVSVSQTHQPDQDAHTGNAAFGQHGLGPSGCMRPDATDLFQQPLGAAFHAGDLFGGDVLRLGTEPAGLVPGVDGDLLQPVVEETHHPAIPARPDRAAE